jgi:hypothetical protein
LIHPPEPWPDPDDFLRELEREFPGFRVVPKRGNCLSSAIDIALRVLTLGGQNAYMTRYHTVMGNTLYVPDSWFTMPGCDKIILLRHERIHLLQRRRMTFLGMAVCYLLWPFPIGLAYGRARLEWEAYTETLRATAQYKGWAAAADPALRAHIVARFTGPDYAWMWPFPKAVGRWYDAVLAEERKGATSRSGSPPSPRGNQ